MKNINDVASELLEHSFLILWNEEKNRWIVECSLLKIRFDTSSYEEALTELCRSILKSNISKEFHEAIEKHKIDYTNITP